MANIHLEQLMGIYYQFVGTGNMTSLELPLLKILLLKSFLAATMDCTIFFMLFILSRAAPLAVFCANTISPS